ncbi:MAG: DotU family type IV/VI secretion system protein, partial [Burkholderiales bacterium]|nr:DotU family type IV/VI secretion system protein [Burkholderiales bacterium]
YLTARLGDEIAHLKGKRATFSPHWQAPDRITHQLKNEVPLWVVASVLAALALIGHIGLRTQLSRFADQALSSPQHIVQLAPQAARVTITLP